MNNEWKMVPVEPTQEMLSSADCNIDGLDPDGAKAQWDALLAAAPLLPSENFASPGILINPTGYKVEHQAALVPPAGDVEVFSLSDVLCQQENGAPGKITGKVIFEGVYRAHVTRLTAELADYMRQTTRYEQLWIDARKERDALQSELTKARELNPINWTDRQVLDFLGVALRNVDLAGEVRLSEIRQGFQFMQERQSAPAAKGGSDE